MLILAYDALHGVLSPQRCLQKLPTVRVSSARIKFLLLLNTNGSECYVLEIAIGVEQY